MRDWRGGDTSPLPVRLSTTGGSDLGRHSATFPGGVDPTTYLTLGQTPRVSEQGVGDVVSDWAFVGQLHRLRSQGRDLLRGQRADAGNRPGIG
jgi:hypothetical protein